MELRHDGLSPLVRSYVTKLPAPTADQFMHDSIFSTYDWLNGLASTFETTSTHTRLNQCTVQPGHRSSSCLSTNNDDHTSWLYGHRSSSWHHQQPQPYQRPTSIIQLTLPTTTIPATDIDHPADSTTNDDIPVDLTNNDDSVTYDKKLLFVILLSHLCPLHCLPAVKLLTHLTTQIICGVDVLIGPATRPPYILRAPTHSIRVTSYPW